ncbi:uncharacterized protein [Panulirus ornatus]|uniref:uncharacterized protein n=1 Tax=Panulirus ornatus TaxID=150431 RepID=UPI003A8C66F9
MCLLTLSRRPSLAEDASMENFAHKVNSGLVRAGLRPITKENMLFYYMPMKGCASYGILSVQMFNPELFENFKFLMIPQYISLTNACLINALSGTGLYLCSRQHLAQATPKEKLLFCTFGTVMFNLGSMLLWALGRTVAPDNSVLRTMMGAAGATGAIYLGRSYVAYLDSHNKST